jgi:hypothetical protein
MRHFARIITAVFRLAGFGCAILLGSASHAATPALPGAFVADPNGSSPLLGDQAATAAPRQLQEVMARVEASGAVEPAARDALMHDLARSDPSLWPLMIEQFKTTMAYRRREADRNGVQLGYAGASSPLAGDHSVYGAAQTSYVSLAPNDLRQALAGAIAALEATSPAGPLLPIDVARETRLRLLYAAADRRDDAVRPIPGILPATQEFVSAELAGLCIWLDVERTPDPAQRAAEAKPLLTEAIRKLSETAPLVVSKVSFCTEVLSYGCIKRFDKSEFCRDQQVLLYAELENFATQPTAKGYHTSLRSKYEILDPHGAQVAKHDFGTTDEYCQNVRHDFFIGYRTRLPKQLALGQYSLRLTVEDLICRKAGQASVELNIKEGKAPEIKREKAGK